MQQAIRNQLFDDVLSAEAVVSVQSFAVDASPFTLKARASQGIYTVGQGPGVHFLYMTPPFITKLTFCSTEISCNGSPGTATTSAR